MDESTKAAINSALDKEISSIRAGLGAVKIPSAVEAMERCTNEALRALADAEAAQRSAIVEQGSARRPQNRREISSKEIDDATRTIEAAKRTYKDAAATLEKTRREHDDELLAAVAPDAERVEDLMLLVVDALDRCAEVCAISHDRFRRQHDMASRRIFAAGATMRSICRDLRSLIPAANAGDL